MSESDLGVSSDMDNLEGTVLSSSEEEEHEEEEQEEEEHESDTETRTSIRKELSGLTFEELEALKSNLGIKVYNEAMFGSKQASTSSSSCTNSRKRKPEVIKRTNKNRPREISSKVRSVTPKVKVDKEVFERKTRIDPRFDSSCGELKDKLWSENYSFISDVQKQEQEYLEQELKKEKDPLKKLEMKKQIQRLKNKERSKETNEKEAEKVKQEQIENRKRIKEGKNPFYMKKSTKKLLDLAEKYDQLKASGKLEKYLKKKRGKNAKRDRKSVNLQQRLD